MVSLPRMRKTLLRLAPALLAFGLVCPGVGWASFEDLVVNEIMYKPASGDVRGQFVELYNRGEKPIDLSGCAFSQAIEFVFPPKTVLRPREFLVLARDAERIKQKYGIENVLGNFDGTLHEYHDTLIFSSPKGFVSQVSYGSDSGWPTAPAGRGPSLELKSPLAASDTHLNWAPSAKSGGTPGLRNSLFTDHPALKISRGPYLTWQHDPRTTMTVNFSSTLPAVGAVEYGETERLGRAAKDARPVAFHAIELMGLNAGAQYFYRAKVGSEVSPTYTFSTAPGPGKPFSFVVYGDNKQGNKTHRALANLMLTRKPTFVMYVGDMVSDGAGWVQYDAYMLEAPRELLARVPIMPAIGDHEHNVRYGVRNRAAGDRNWRRLFALPGDGFDYSFDMGDAHFVALHYDELYSQGKVWRWLEHDLAQTKQRWKFVYSHRPPYSSACPRKGRTYSDTRMRAICCPLFERLKVNATFAGHIHNYERSFANGVYHIVSGGGGGGLTKGEFMNPPPKWSLARRRVYHFTHVAIDGRRLALEAVGLDGKVFDRMTLEK